MMYTKAGANTPFKTYLGRLAQLSPEHPMRYCDPTLLPDAEEAGPGHQPRMRLHQRRATALPPELNAGISRSSGAPFLEIGPLLVEHGTVNTSGMLLHGHLG